MIRNSWFVLLLIFAAGPVLANEAPEAETVDRTPGAQAPAETVTEDATSSEGGEEGDPETEAKMENGAKRISGMSILGNQEAPKSLVIVPWKSSEIGESLGISSMLDDSRHPVDREVFLRALTYYEIRSDRTP